MEVTIKKSLNTQRTSYGMMAEKTDGNAKGRVEQQKILARSRRAMVRGLRRRTAMLRVILGPGNGPKSIAHNAD